MLIEGLDPVLISKLTSQQIEQVTCIECCKYFIAPETAICGHSLCHACWRGRRSCYVCSIPVDKKALKLNRPLQTLTEHVHALGDAFEKLFNVKLDEFALDIPNEITSDDPTKNVKEWLASSQNHFSAPVLSSQSSQQDVIIPLELSQNKILVHTQNQKSLNIEKIIRPPPPQDDWDKIEILPDTGDTCEKSKQHVVGPMDFDPFFMDENEYSTKNPRRSSRKREIKAHSNPPSHEVSSTKNSSHDTDKKSLKYKQTWGNVKKMRKEFSKLNQKNKSKLNVSIEMCKKAQRAKNLKSQNDAINLAYSGPICINIDEDTPLEKESSKNTQNTQLRETALDSNKITDSIKQNIATHTQLYEISNKSISKSLIKNYNNSGNLRNSKDHQSEKNSQNNQDTENKLKSKSEVNNEIRNFALSSKEAKNMPFIKKGTLCQKATADKNDSVHITHNEIESKTVTKNPDDIEISIKIGNTITNIVIKNKQNDVQLKVNSDQEVQTSLGSHGLSKKNDVGCSPIKGINVQNIQLTVGEGNKVAVKNSTSTKKNTASADTASAQFEITDSVEKELSNEMICGETPNNECEINETPQIHKASRASFSQVIEVEANKVNEMPVDMDYLNENDIFNSGSIKEQNVKLFKDSNHTPSEILIPTIKSKKSHKSAEKRDRDINPDTELPCSKKQKLNLKKHIAEIDDISAPGIADTQSREANESEPMNYDAIMSQVFANIDAEIHNPVKFTQKSTKTSDATGVTKNSQPQASQIIKKTQLIQKNVSTAIAQNTSILKEIVDQKYSENVFSLIENSHNVSGKNNSQFPDRNSTLQHIENLLTPGMCHNLAAGQDAKIDKDEEILEPILGTPIEDPDDSDKSVVEETPQKNISFSKPKQIDALKPVINNKQKSLKLTTNAEKYCETADSQIIKSIINISDTSEEFTKIKDATVIDLAKRKNTLETPLTINKFVNHIKHNSTPVARKSLNFENENFDDPEQTLCPTTTQEKEFLANAFEKTPNSPIKKPIIALKSVYEKQNRKLYVAGSCLSSTEIKDVKALCLEQGWTFLDRYTDDLTHLVVGVDEENKSQRSVKYMCALAASKWIVTYSWIEKCLQQKTVVDEVMYEALDATGEPGPRRSRTAIKKIFEGITFYCMPPFSVLEVDTLKQMLKAAGAQVSEDPQGVKITPERGVKPALLLAEPEHTQEDRFVYLAMEHSVVPVNYEWALNCLGAYVLGSIHDLLLCPPTLLPPATANWPAILLQNEEDD